MARFIEEFYYGNIDPQARSMKRRRSSALTPALSIQEINRLSDRKYAYKAREKEQRVFRT